MKIKLIILFLLSNVLYAQKNYFELKSLKVSEIPTIEAQFASKQFKESQKHIYAENNFARPINYARSATKNFTSATIRYFYSVNDSIVKSINFHWNLNIDEKLSLAARVEKCNIAFDNLIKSMSGILGNPNPDQGKLTEKQSPVAGDETVHYERKVVWNINSKTITSSIVWSENNGQQMVTIIR